MMKTMMKHLYRVPLLAHAARVTGQTALILELAHRHLKLLDVNLAVFLAIDADEAPLQSLGEDLTEYQ
jgi:hypothetical protein